MRVSCDWVLANSSHVFNLLCLFVVVVVVVIFYVISPTVSTHPRSQRCAPGPGQGIVLETLLSTLVQYITVATASGICSPFSKWLLLA